MNPKAPVTTNAVCQLYAPSSQGTSIGATTAPMLAPELNNPVAKARSRLGNHSATLFMAAGKLPDSPTPNAVRATANPKVLRTAACNKTNILQITIETV